MPKKLPHITHPIDDARRLINAANHHVWRAGHIDTAYELDKTIKQLRQAITMVEAIQQDYDFGPDKIDLTKPAWDPALLPGPEDDDGA